ncbi:MAG: hypothetical protein FHP92_14850 [Denitromonas halophila]|nr:MAG: hypothetical protein FHP92_14850 [Denitromonas halophila]
MYYNPMGWLAVPAMQSYIDDIVHICGQFGENVMNAKTQPAGPEIRLRLDPETHQQFTAVGESIGMTATDMVRVFVRRAILAEGLPFDMAKGLKAANDDLPVITESKMQVHGASINTIAAIASQAAAAADREHVREGRLPAAATAVPTR